MCKKVKSISVVEGNGDGTATQGSCCSDYAEMFETLGDKVKQYQQNKKALLQNMLDSDDRKALSKAFQEESREIYRNEEVRKYIETKK